MVDVQDEDDVVFLSPAGPVRPLKRKKQQQVDIIDLSSPTPADGETNWQAFISSKDCQATVRQFRAAHAWRNMQLLASSASCNGWPRLSPDCCHLLS
jgi:hypothetical protein